MAEQCIAPTATGRRCRAVAVRGTSLCHVHTGSPVGRPSKLTVEAVAKIEQVLRAGGYAETAAEVAGIGWSTFTAWLRRGKPDGTDPADAVYRAFRVRIAQAHADAETRNVALIAQAATENWQAAAWLLERRYPERWARASQREKDQPPPGLPLTSDPFSEVDELAQRRRDTRGE